MLAGFHAIQLRWPRQANELFVTMPRQLADTLHKAGAEFYHWPARNLPQGVELGKDDIFVRLVTSFATEDDHISRFCELIGENLTSEKGV